MRSLTDIFPADLADFLAHPPAPAMAYRTPTQLNDVLYGWEENGAQLMTFGSSRSGRAIHGAVLGHGPRTLLSWGYPHPDEPLGAEALVWLGDAFLHGELPSLRDWQLVLILCADQDESSRQLWFDGPRNLTTFARGAWRPMKLDVMVDYGFPLDWGPFWQPASFQGACRSRTDCRLNCGETCAYARRPPGPLPESLALAQALDLFQPDVVAAMHCTHTGGDYTFLLEREPRSVWDDLLAVPGACGRPRHLGERIDRGGWWRRDAPDLFKEYDLEHFRRWLEKQPSYEPDLVYHMNHSAACYVQAQGNGAQFVCPEATMFTHPDFGDESLLPEREWVRYEVQDRRRGRYRTRSIKIGDDWVVAGQTISDEQLSRQRPRKEPVWRGALGVRALMSRRAVLHQADLLWQRTLDAGELIPHPYLEERALITVPGAYVHDRAMLIFRTRADYQRPATRAQAASFRWVWPAHTATLLANFQNFLHAQDLLRPELAQIKRELDALQDEVLAQLPAELQQESARGDALASMLGRVLVLMGAHGKDIPGLNAERRDLNPVAQENHDALGVEG